MKKNLFYLAAFALAVAVLPSCSDDDNEGGNPNVPGGSIELPVGATLAGETASNVELVKNGSYTLSGKYVVKAGTTLTINEGVTITADADDNVVDYIIVEPGAKMNAVGTASNPILMTASEASHGAWGGLHICGKAKVNNGTALMSEVGDVTYGGNDDADNSGIYKYIRVEYAGYLYSEDKECNGFTFYGVGNGTTLENLIAYKGSDDGYEWFGGCVNSKNLISIDNEDDSFDWTYGFTGTIDGAYAKQLTANCDHLLEGDSNKNNPSTTLPISKPTIKNAVLVGQNGGGDRGLRIRRGSQIVLDNVQVYGKTNSFDFQSAETKAYFTANAATALKSVKSDAGIVDALENAPLSASIFSGLTVDASMSEPAAPSWTSWTKVN